MDKEQIKKTIDSPLEYDESKEDTYCSLLRDFFSKKIRWFTINFYAWSIFFMAVAIISAIQFFKTDQTQFQIMYAALFVCGFNGISLMKILGFQMINRLGIKREIRKLIK